MNPDCSRVRPRSPQGARDLILGARDLILGARDLILGAGITQSQLGREVSRAVTLFRTFLALRHLPRRSRHPGRRPRPQWRRCGGRGRCRAQPAVAKCWPAKTTKCGRGPTLAQLRPPGFGEMTGPRSQMTAPRSQMAAPRSQMAAPRSQMAAPRSQIAAAELAQPLS